MRSLAVLVVVISLGVGASSMCLGFAKEVDFKRLNKHLLAKLANNEAREENLAVIKADLDSFKNAGTKRAAQVVLRLAEVNHHSECDRELINTLNLASKGELRSYDDLKPTRRVERLIRAELIMALDTCNRLIEETFPKLLKATDARVLKLSDAITPTNPEKIAYRYTWPGSSSMAKSLLEAARDHPLAIRSKSGHSPMSSDWSAFKNIYMNHIIPRCEYLIEQFDNLLRLGTDIATIRGSRREFGQPEFRRLARTNSICKKIKWDKLGEMTPLSIFNSI